MSETSATARAEAVAIFEAAICAVDPASLVGTYLSQSGRTVDHPPPTLVIGAGKAAARMAAGCEAALGGAYVRGEVIVPDNTSATLNTIAVSAAGHPLPDARGEKAARRIVQHLRRHQKGDVICLISGGASSLLVCPRPPVTLRDKVVTTQRLLECGADIGAVNTVRKHLSEVKGGGLLRQVRTPMRGLLISDVIGDDPSIIGSGPTACDDSTFADAWGVLRSFDLTERVPASVTQLLQAGMAGRAPETVKPGTAEAGRCRNIVIGSNRTALEAAAIAARARGWTVHIHKDPLRGDTTEAARAFGTQIGQMAAQCGSEQRLCVLAGGETTVRIVGRGRGGRNQEFAAALATAMAGAPITILSAGTDGIDGPTDAAGAFVDGTTAARGRARGLTAEAALADNDSYEFFSRIGDLFRCGPTGTNVMDIKIALVSSAIAAATS